MTHADRARLRALAEKPMESMRATELAEIRVALPHLLDALEEAEASRDAWCQSWELQGVKLLQARRRIGAALNVLDGRFRPTDRIGDLHGAMTRALRGDL